VVAATDATAPGRTTFSPTRAGIFACDNPSSSRFEEGWKEYEWRWNGLLDLLLPAPGGEARVRRWGWIRGGDDRRLGVMHFSHWPFCNIQNAAHGSNVHLHPARDRRWLTPAHDATTSIVGADDIYSRAIDTLSAGHRLARIVDTLLPGIDVTR
jgi:hypothetical protein